MPELLYGEWVEHNVLAAVAHRQYVFTLPKLLRPIFSRRRAWLGDLCRIAARLLAAAYAEAAPGARPGLILFVQTFGEPQAAGRVIELEGLHQDGTQFPIEASLAHWVVDEGRFVTAIIRNVSERKRAQDALRDSGSRLRDAQRIAQLGNWELDLVANRLTWSGEIFRIFEIDKTRFGATYDAFLAAIHPQDRDAVNAAYTRFLETREPYGIIHRLLMPDGRIKHVQEQCESSFDAEGRPIRSVGTVQDITELKRLEDDLRRLNEELE